MTAVPVDGRLDVVHVLSYFPPHLGGMEQRVDELCAELGRDPALTVEVLTSSIGSRPGRERRSDGVVVRRLWAVEAARTPVIPTLPLHLLRTPRAAVWHLHVAHAWSADVTWLLARLQHRRYVAHVRIDPQPSSWMGFALGWWRRHVLTRVLRDAAAVVVSTQGYRELLVDKYGVLPARVHVVPNGTRFQPALTRPADTATTPDVGGPRLLSVGRLARQKNLPLLLAAVAVLRERGVPVSLSLVGDGEERRHVLEEVARLGLDGVVRLDGTLSGDALRQAYRDADAFVMTSTEESFGSVLVEAMAHGVPVVAPDIVAVRDVVVDGVNGLLVPPRVEAVADAVGRVVLDPRLRDRLVAGGYAAVARYSWPRIAGEIAALYRHVQAER